MIPIKSEASNLSRVLNQLLCTLDPNAFVCVLRHASRLTVAAKEWMLLSVYEGE